MLCMAEPPSDASAAFLSFLDELRIMAQVGLEHADDPYDRQRYERMLELVSEWYGRAFELPSTEVRERFAADVGYVTPKVSADAAVFNEEGQIVLQQRVDSHEWCLPCGYTDPNESPEETAVRETLEETGLTVKPISLIDTYARKPGEYGPHCLVAHLYLCERVDGVLECSHEGVDVQYRAIESVSNWHTNHAELARDAYDVWKNS